MTWVKNKHFSHDVKTSQFITTGFEIKVTLLVKV